LGRILPRVVFVTTGLSVLLYEGVNKLIVRKSKT
jgi:hypothetical protein